jgi:DNA-binding response OmpR family regulator
MHILVVEDEVRLARVIVSALIKAGHEPVVIHDGELVLQKAASESLKNSKKSPSRFLKFRPLHSK